MRRHFPRPVILAIVLSVLLPSASAGQPVPKPKRLRVPAVVRGLIGGESNDTYVVHVRKGRSLKVQISWRSEDQNTASFSVGRSPDFEPLQFGRESEGGRKWIGKVPKTGDYIEVVAHPAAHYVLRITAK